MLDLAYLNSGALDGAKDTDADFNGTIDIDDLVFIDSDWGESLHTGDKTFTGIDSMDWEELSTAASGATWNDSSFQKQNTIETGADFQDILNLGSKGEDNMSIEDKFFQVNELEQVDPVG